MDLGLKDKRVLVAAASKGLGRAIAAEFVIEGARVAICSRERERIEQVAKAIGAERGIAADVSTEAGCRAFVEGAAKALGGIDVLIVNAGGPKPGTFADLDDAAWQKAFELTLLSAVRLTRLAVPELKRSKGSIVFSTSTSVRQPGSPAYGTLMLSNGLRAAVHGLLKTLSTELAADGIRVNAIQPGRISTERIAELDADTAKREGVPIEQIQARFEKGAIPLGRYGRPEEFAAAAVFLASPRASYITGVSLQVDGGMLTSMW
ncbi:MAG: 3-oxoacyl-[acyl-carrier protein] reductase [Chloroflexota bacterium]|nr:3-oxoacyl-[acyl-carrier protein] reductase [Chloroflexota bacterium]